MEIAAGPGRRPAPAAGRAGVRRQPFRNLRSSRGVREIRPLSRRSRCALPRSPRPLPTMSGDAVSRALVDPMQRRRDRPPRLHRDLGWTAIDESNQRLPTMEPARVDTRVLRQRAAWLAVGCLVLRWVSGRGRPGRRLHEIGAWPAIFRSSSITNCGSAGCSRSASTGPLLSSGGRQVLAGFRADRGNAAASIGYFLVRCPRGERWTDDDFQCRKVGAPQPPVTVIIGGRALLMLIAARFSGSDSGKDLLSRAISLIASGLLPFSSFPIPVAPDSYRGRDRPACRIPCARRGMAHRVRPQ